LVLIFNAFLSFSSFVNFLSPPPRKKIRGMGYRWLECLVIGYSRWWWYRIFFPTQTVTRDFYISLNDIVLHVIFGIIYCLIYVVVSCHSSDRCYFLWNWFHWYGSFSGQSGINVVKYVDFPFSIIIPPLLHVSSSQWHTWIAFI
jgi:hypothetical protein